MDKLHLQELLHRYLHQTATPAEREALFALVRSGQQEALLDEAAAQVDLSTIPALPLADAASEEILQAILTASATGSSATIQPLPTRSQRWWRYAAAVILLLGAATYLWLRPSSPDTPHPVSIAAEDIQPGQAGAILTLSDGRKVVLDSLGNGVVAQQPGSQAILRNGALVYDPTGTVAGSLTYNTMTTPKGRQFSLQLPDGTQVWLNAASSIRYPTVFADTARTVAVTGEAYFEVARHAKAPFRVTLPDKTQIEVLGTTFNVNAYDNEKTINTTLLTGAVRVHAGGQQVTLRPGQQAQVSTTSSLRSGIQVIRAADVDKAMAWKNGYFDFEDASLEEILRQLERWYAIDVVYEQGVPALALSGEMTRAVSLDMLLTVLKKMGLHYSLQGRQLIVHPSSRS